MGKATKEKGSDVISSDEKLRQLDNLLVAMDIPNEGDEIFFFIEGDPNKYRGTLIRKHTWDKGCKFVIESRTHPIPIGKIIKMESRGKIFKIS